MYKTNGDFSRKQFMSYKFSYINNNNKKPLKLTLIFGIEVVYGLIKVSQWVKMKKTPNFSLLCFFNSKEFKIKSLL